MGKNNFTRLSEMIHATQNHELGPRDRFSQQFIFFVTHEGDYEARVLYCIKIERFGTDKHSNFLGPFVKQIKWKGCILENFLCP